jgi:galactitol-specific phosphotransferase system IIC component
MAVGFLVGAVVGDLVGLAVGSLVGLGLGSAACIKLWPIVKSELKKTLDKGLDRIASFEDENFININIITCFKKSNL